MSKLSKIWILGLRIAIGWIFFYAGITKILSPAWSAEGYLNSAKTFSAFYHWLANPGIIKVTDLLNEWGLTLIGVSLILGIFVRVSGILGAAMMILYYIPILDFPMVGKHSYMVDEHIIYALILLLLSALNAGKIIGVDKFLSRN